MRLALLAALVLVQAAPAFDVASIKPNTSDEVMPGVRFYPGTFNFRGVLIANLVRFGLASRVGRTVIDRTGLTGRFDLDLEFAPSNRLQASPDAADASADGSPSIFTPLQEQLALKLRAEKGPVDVLVIDRAEHPDEQ